MQRFVSQEPLFMEELSLRSCQQIICSQFINLALQSAGIQTLIFANRFNRRTKPAASKRFATAIECCDRFFIHLPDGDRDQGCVICADRWWTCIVAIRNFWINFEARFFMVVAHVIERTFNVFDRLTPFTSDQAVEILGDYRPTWFIKLLNGFFKQNLVVSGRISAIRAANPEFFLFCHLSPLSMGLWRIIRFGSRAASGSVAGPMT